MLAITLLLISTVLANTPGVSDSEIVIGSSGAFSSPAVGPGSRGVRDGAVRYFEYINKQGGVNGRKIKYIPLDDEYDPARAKDNINSLLTKHHVFAIVGGNGGAGVAAYLPLLEKDKVPLIFPYAPNDFIYEPFKRHVFAFPAKTEVLAQQVIDHIVKKERTHVFGAIYQDDVAFRSLVAATAKSMAKHGLSWTRSSSIERTKTDTGTQLEQILTSKPGAVFVGTNGIAASDFIRRSAERRFFPIFFSLYSLPLEFLEKIPQKENIRYFGVDAIPNPDATKLSLIDDFKSIIGDYDRNWTNRYLFGYLIAKTFVEGLRRAGRDLTREKLIIALESLTGFDLGGIIVNLGPRDHTALDAGYLYAFEKGSLREL